MLATCDIHHLLNDCGLSGMDCVWTFQALECPDSEHTHISQHKC